MAYTKTPAGRLQRLTVAVLIDNVRTTGKDGKVKATALTDEQLAHVTQLVKDAVGYSETRGDSVNVVNSPFREDALPAGGALESIPLWEQPWVLNVARIVAGLIVVLVLVFSVLKPLLRNLLGPPKVIASPQMLAADGPGDEPRPRGEGAAAQVAAPLAYEQQLAQARTLVGQDPKRVAQVVRAWVATDE